MGVLRSVLIIGGGIAGPAMALFLKRAGMQPILFEAHAPAKNIGGGFQIAPNGMRVLDSPGLAQQVIAFGESREAQQRGELGPIGCWMRDRMLACILSWFGERSFRWLYEYE